jgi:4,5-DOPA dioxygenase extradiol
MTIPAVFLSHGAPTLAVDEGHETRAWAELAAKLPRPKSILAVSAHWDTRDPEVSAAARPETIHDFSGFPKALYEQRYPARGAPELATRVSQLLQAAGAKLQVVDARPRPRRVGPAQVDVSEGRHSCHAAFGAIASRSGSSREAG